MTHRDKTSKSGLYIIIGIAILLGTIYLISSGNPFARLNSNRTNDPGIVGTNSSYETVHVGHTAFALNPKRVNLKAGTSYKLIITPTENGGGCMNTMTMPGLDDNVYPVKAGQSVTISIDNAQAGNYDVICGAMGMYQGTIVVQ